MSVFTPLNKGTILVDSCSNFNISETAQSYFNYTSSLQKLQHFLEVREPHDTESCNLDFGWLSVRCKNGTSDDGTSSNVCANEKWYRNKTCGEIDQCNIFFSLSGTLWKQGEASQAAAIALYTASMQRILRYKSGSTTEIGDLFAIGVQHNSAESYKSIHFGNMLKTCFRAQIKLLAESGEVLQELYFKCVPGSSENWFSRHNLQDILYGEFDDFKESVKYHFKGGNAVRNRFTIVQDEPCGIAAVLLHVACEYHCFYDHRSEHCEIIYSENASGNQLLTADVLEIWVFPTSLSFPYGPWTTVFEVQSLCGINVFSYYHFGEIIEASGSSVVYRDKIFRHPQLHQMIENAATIRVVVFDFEMANEVQELQFHGGTGAVSWFSNTQLDSMTYWQFVPAFMGLKEISLDLMFYHTQLDPRQPHNCNDQKVWLAMFLKNIPFYCDFHQWHVSPDDYYVSIEETDYFVREVLTAYPNYEFQPPLLLYSPVKQASKGSQLKIGGKIRIDVLQ